MDFEEELFGPVASIIPAKDENDEIRLDNTSSFCLGAGVLLKMPPMANLLH
ncbi:aldehyde dehydrogenase family protein [Mucilaginibacter sp. UR6-1]|uniref:aldehyde dehydrogenase family protein n=1 Tax=Mucilaginibacter sp. UR6-1 TaxID=1435643 RepID=UPI00351CD960